MMFDMLQLVVPCSSDSPSPTHAVGGIWTFEASPNQAECSYPQITPITQIFISYPCIESV